MGGTGKGRGGGAVYRIIANKSMNKNKWSLETENFHISFSGTGEGEVGTKRRGK